MQTAEAPLLWCLACHRIKVETAKLQQGDDRASELRFGDHVRTKRRLTRHVPLPTIHHLAPHHHPPPTIHHTPATNEYPTIHHPPTTNHHHFRPRLPPTSRPPCKKNCFLHLLPPALRFATPLWGGIVKLVLRPLPCGPQLSGPLPSASF